MPKMITPDRPGLDGMIRALNALRPGEELIWGISHGKGAVTGFSDLGESEVAWLETEAQQLEKSDHIMIFHRRVKKGKSECHLLARGVAPDTKQRLHEAVKRFEEAHFGHKPVQALRRTRTRRF